MSYPSAPSGQPVGQPQTNKKAIWSLVTGILSVTCCGIFGAVAALILSNLAKKEIAASNGTQTGGGMATAGLVLGIISLIGTVIYIILLATGAATLDFSGSTSSSSF